MQLLHCGCQLLWREFGRTCKGCEMLLQFLNLTLVQPHLLVVVFYKLLEVQVGCRVLILQRRWCLLGVVSNLRILQVLCCLAFETLYGSGIPLDSILHSAKQLSQGCCFLLHLSYGMRGYPGDLFAHLLLLSHVFFEGLNSLHKLWG